VGIYYLDSGAASLDLHPECAPSGKGMPSAGPVQPTGFDHFHRVTTQYGIAAPLSLDPYLLEIQTFRNNGGLIMQCRTHLAVIDLLQSHDIRLMDGNHIGNAFRRYLAVSADAAVNVIGNDYEDGSALDLTL
jgi:hypothetical protein